MDPTNSHGPDRALIEKGLRPHATPGFAVRTRPDRALIEKGLRRGTIAVAVRRDRPDRALIEKGLRRYCATSPPLASPSGPRPDREGIKTRASASASASKRPDRALIE